MPDSSNTDNIGQETANHSKEISIEYAVKPQSIFSRAQSAEMLADSVITLIRYGWAFVDSTRLWSPKDYKLKRWRLSREEAELWNELYAPIVRDASAGGKPISSAQLAEDFKAVKRVATEVIISFTQFFCELWLANLWFQHERAIRDQKNWPESLELGQSRNTATSLTEWRIKCIEWARNNAQRMHEEMIENEKIAAEEKELFRAAQIMLATERAQKAAAVQVAAAKAHADELKYQAQLAALRIEYKESLERNYIETSLAAHYSNELCSLTRADRHQIESDFAEEWLKNPENIILKEFPNQEQLQAISRIEPKLLVRARAGSGKTKTIVLRTVFLIKHCRVSPRGILLFAFNKSAAEKLEADLMHALGLEGASDDEKLLGLPIVQTFDAFALAVSMQKPFEPFELADLYRGAIEQLLATDYKRVKAAMLGFFRGEWDRIEADILPGKVATLTGRRTYQPDGARLTLNGEQVKSRGEHRIANWLFEHGIPYKYERHIRLPKISWAPDFTLYPEDPRPIIIEYLGMQGDPEYDKKTTWKKEKIKEIPDEKRPAAVWLAPASTIGLSNEGQHFSRILSALLTAEGHIIRKLSDDEIWDQIKDKALSKFRDMLISITGRAYQLGWSHVALRTSSVHSEVPEIISLCADVMEHIAAHNTSGKLSYAEICWNAISELKKSKEMSRELLTQGRQRRLCNLADVSEVIVDEFQDYALRFDGLVQGLLGIATRARFFAVGDDWQAINRFAGSDAGYIEQWPDSECEVVLPINYRSLPEIVAAGNTLMRGRGPLASAPPSTKLATLVRMNLEDLEITELEKEAVHDLTNIRSDVSIGISRLAIPHIKIGESVAVLSRSKHEIDIVKGKRKEKASLKKMLLEMAGSNTAHVDVDTVHGYKGREADVVILLADNFPLVHPERVISEIFGDTEEKVLEDERRLLYVGITRAKSTLYVLTGVKRRRNPLEAELPLSSGDWIDYPPVGEHINASEKLLVTLSGWGTSEIKSSLLSAKFKWRPQPLNRWERVESQQNDPMVVLSQVISAAWFPKEPLESEFSVEVINAIGEVLARKTVYAKDGSRLPDRNLNRQPHSVRSSTPQPEDLDDLPF